MQVTMSSDYALRTLMQIAREGKDVVIPIRFISREWQIPEKYLRKIVPLLARAGLIHSHRGNGGGISLARPATDITPRAVIEAIDGPITLNRCLSADHFCQRENWCPMHTLWLQAREQLESVLDSKTLAQLAGEGAEQINCWLPAASTKKQ